MPLSRTNPQGQRSATTGPGLRASKRAILVGVLSAGMVVGSVVAQEPTPNTFVDVSVPQLTSWNEVNRLTVEPGIDGYTGATARTHIYTSEAAKDAAQAALTNAPDAPETEDTLWTDSAAVVYWELDDGSGRAPGIQVVTDDFDFPTNNCIMASGEREADDFEGTIVPKTCSDAPSSSKRYFLEIVEAGTPVDLVFDVGLKDIRYGGVKDPVDDGGEALEAFREEYGIGRIYRVIQKVINNTDQRLVGVKVELGHGVGDSFVPFDVAEDDVAFELRTMVPREFFDGETGAPDVAVWNESRFAHFAPKLFDTGERERFPPGFLSDQAAGLFPPQEFDDTSDKTQFIFSGDDTNANGYTGAITQNYFSMVDEQAMGTVLPRGLFGYWLSDSLATTVIGRYDEGDPAAESDAIEAWWDGYDWRYGQAGDAAGLNPFGVVAPDQLEQWATQLLGRNIPDGAAVRYDSILGDDFANLNMDAYIYIGEGILDAEGNPKYDSITYRVTAVPTTDFQGVGNETPAWADGGAGSPAPELASYLPATGEPVALNDLVTMYENDQDSPYWEPGAETANIEVLANDLLDGQLLLNSGATIDAVTIVSETGGDAVVQADNTVDFTPDVGFTGLASFTYTVSIPGPTTSNEATVAVRVNAYPDPEAPVASNDSAVTFENTPVTIDVLSNDALPAGEPAVAVLDEPLTGSAVIENNEVVYTPAADFTGLDRFTYTVTSNGKVSNAALITVRIDETPVVEPPSEEPNDASSSDDSDGIFGCSYNPGAPFDPTLLLLALGAIGGLTWRNRKATD
ncbi:choice-of-anchor F family protein [Marinobacter lacisalsi]|uniref:Choice-of-anchor F family protein n=1 Tax=Marinobacter lacisalsi TaxID=475979 RepID=A0ABV8QHQ7_9GAMM